MPKNNESIIFKEKYNKNGELISVLRYLDKKNILSKNYLAIPVWKCVVFGYTFAAISVIFSAAIYIYFFTKRPGLYTEDCSDRSCVSGFNMKCINSVCSCQSTQYYLKGCFDKKGYLGKCHGNTSYCADNKNFECLDGLCKCNITSYWSGTLCLPKKDYGVSCSSDVQCLTDKQLICDQKRKKCYCSNERYWDNTACFPKKKLNETCESTYQCRDYENLYCQNGICSCLSTDYWNITKCRNKNSYGTLCSSSFECDDAGGLYCPTTANTCNCPKNDTTIFCDCPSNMFFNFGLKLCSPIMTLNGYCDATYECNKTAELVCENNACVCPTIGKWFWSNYTEKCVECHSDWIIESGHCYYVSNISLNWQSSENYCKSYGANLIKIDDTAEYNVLYDFYVNNGGGKNLWVGASTYNQYMNFTWTYDGSSFNRSSSFWCNGEPNNWGGSPTNIKEGCSFMWRTGTKICLNDISCTTNTAFVCEKSK